MTDNEVLFQYLRSILFDATIETPARESLGEQSQPLYEGLCFLAKCVEEYRAYAEALSSGSLAKSYGSRENTLCYPLKNLHANLRHLTWQAKRVAEGDYTQEVSFLGEFSDAFNSMTRQLREREEQIRQTIERIERQKEALRQSNELLVSLTSNINELIMVNDAQTGEALYVNKPEALDASEGAFAALQERITQYAQDGRRPGEWIFEYEAEHLYFRIFTFAVEWNERATLASVAHDVTADWLKAQELEESVSRDPATGLYNRRYCMARLESYIADKIPFSLCYIDLDNLKYVNDTYGHLEGDRYISEVAREITRQIRRGDVCARMGGDEFVVLFRQCPGAVAEEKMGGISRRIAEAFGDQGVQRRGISYGIVEIDYSQPVTPDALLARADQLMYETKRKNKTVRED